MNLRSNFTFLTLGVGSRTMLFTKFSQGIQIATGPCLYTIRFEFQGFILMNKILTFVIPEFYSLLLSVFAF